VRRRATTRAHTLRAATDAVRYVRYPASVRRRCGWQAPASPRDPGVGVLVRLPDLLPTQADLVPIGALAPAELEKIDCVLLAHATPRRQKMATVIARMMRELADQLPKNPFV